MANKVIISLIRKHVAKKPKLAQDFRPNHMGLSNIPKRGNEFDALWLTFGNDVVLPLEICLQSVRVQCKNDIQSERHLVFTFLLYTFATRSFCRINASIVVNLSSFKCSFFWASKSQSFFLHASLKSHSSLISLSCVLIWKLTFWRRLRSLTNWVKKASNSIKYLTIEAGSSWSASASKSLKISWANSLSSSRASKKLCSNSSSFNYRSVRVDVTSSSDEGVIVEYEGYASVESWRSCCSFRRASVGFRRLITMISPRVRVPVDTHVSTTFGGSWVGRETRFYWISGEIF